MPTGAPPADVAGVKKRRRAKRLTAPKRTKRPVAELGVQKIHMLLQQQPDEEPEEEEVDEDLDEEDEDEDDTPPTPPGPSPQQPASFSSDSKAPDSKPDPTSTGFFSSSACRFTRARLSVRAGASWQGLLHHRCATQERLEGDLT